VFKEIRESRVLRVFRELWGILVPRDQLGIQVLKESKVIKVIRVM